MKKCFLFWLAVASCAWCEREYLLASGDLISIPPGPEYAHQIVNNGDEDLTYLAISTMEEPDIVLFPDSNKISVVGRYPTWGRQEQRTLNFIGDLEQQLGYWHGET
jgi:uncharacterized cupin superfamily protein